MKLETDQDIIEFLGLPAASKEEASEIATIFRQVAEQEGSWEGTFLWFAFPRADLDGLSPRECILVGKAKALRSVTGKK